MPTLESLQAKRTDLKAHLEQHVGQINRINGAVALLDDLIEEAEAAAEAEEAEEAAAQEAAAQEAAAQEAAWAATQAAAAWAAWTADNSHDAPPYRADNSHDAPVPYRADDSDAA